MNMASILIYQTLMENLDNLSPVLFKIKDLALTVLLIIAFIGIGWSIFRRANHDINTAELVQSLVLNGILILAVIFINQIKTIDDLTSLLYNMNEMFT